jgi:predicted MPP superfamily phosphohydrolase
MSNTLFTHENIEIIGHNISFGGYFRQSLVLLQLSDLHINRWNIIYLDEIIEKTNAIKPDIIVFTGDFICSGKKYIPDLINFLQKLTAKYGKYACLGNHDHSDGDDGKRIIKACCKSSFQMLVNEPKTLSIKGKELIIAGADDIELGEQNIEKMAKNISQQAKSIFLTHNPVNFRAFAEYSPNLVLSGHTHGGQIYSRAVKLLYNLLFSNNYISGLYEHNGSTLYVNKGIGTAMLSPVLLNKKVYINTPRINTKPEITVFYIQ